MVRFKTKRKNNLLFVRTTFSSEESISPRELEVLSEWHIRGLLRPHRVRKRRIEFTGSAGISLYQRLQRPVSKYEFFLMMKQIADIVQKTEKQELPQHNLLLDLRYVFINEATKELQFLYLPLVSNHLSMDIIGFMQSIIYSCNSFSNQNSEYISQYANFISSLEHFSADAIEQYLAKTEDESTRLLVETKEEGTVLLWDKEGAL